MCESEKKGEAGYVENNSLKSAQVVYAEAPRNSELTKNDYVEDGFDEFDEFDA